MDIIKIIRIEIVNFKGIKRLDVQLDGQDAHIIGRNASGKTTVQDAFLWTLFGRDTRGAATFDVFKPLGDDGAPVLGTETSVTVTLDINGTQHVLRRGIVERWESNRQRAEKVYKGDTGAYSVDEVPKSKGEYEDFVKSILPEDKFKVITNYEEFMRKNTAQRRLVLLSMTPTNIDAILAERHPDLAEALEGHGAEDQKKRIRSLKEAAQKELDGIPVRIDELRAGMVGADAADRDRLVKSIEGHRREIGEIDQQLARDPKAGARSQLASVDGKISEIEQAAARKHTQEVEDARRTMSNAQNDLTREQQAAQRATSSVEKLEASIRKLTQERDAKREQYNIAFASTFVQPEIDGVCPACGQAIPQEQIASAIEQAEAAFNEKKLAKLSEIRSAGLSTNGIIAEQQKLLEEHKADKEKAEAAVEELQRKFDKAAETYRKVSAEIPTFPIEHATLMTQRKELQTQVNAPESDAVAHIRERRRKIEEFLTLDQQDLARIDVLKENTRKVDAYETRQRELGDQIVALNQRAFSVDQYIRERCKLLEESINAKFPSVRWRLFVDNKGDGYTDACDCMITGPGGQAVPYEQANTGARINAGMEIVNVLSDAYGVIAPVFVDNAESVNEVARTVGQQILLNVTEDDLEVITFTKGA